LHEAIRQYALAHLEETPNEYLRACDAHSAFYLEFAAAHETALKSAQQPAAAQEMLTELDNLRAAWAWALRRENFSALGLAIRAFGWFFEVSGLIHEGIEHFEPLICALQAEPEHPAWQVLGNALTQQALLCFRKGHFDRAQRQLEQGLEIFRAHAERTFLTDALIYLGVIMHLEGELDRSQSLFEEGLACAQAAGYDWLAAYALYNLGYLASLRGQYAQGRAQMEEGMAMWRKLGDPHSIALGLNYLTPTLVHLGEYDQARAFLLESLELCQRAGTRWGMGTAYRCLGFVAMAQGDLHQAEARYHQALETFGDYIVGWDIAKTLVLLGEVNLLADNLAQAQTILADTLQLTREIHPIPLMLDALLGLARLQLCVAPARIIG